jgi:hypothetical protein
MSLVVFFPLLFYGIVLESLIFLNGGREERVGEGSSGKK